MSNSKELCFLLFFTPPHIFSSILGLGYCLSSVHLMSLQFSSRFSGFYLPPKTCFVGQLDTQNCLKMWMCVWICVWMVPWDGLMSSSMSILTLCPVFLRSSIFWPGWITYWKWINENISLKDFRGNNAYFMLCKSYAWGVDDSSTWLSWHVELINISSAFCGAELLPSSITLYAVGLAGRVIHSSVALLRKLGKALKNLGITASLTVSPWEKERTAEHSVSTSRRWAGLLLSLMLWHTQQSLGGQSY